MTRLWPLFFLVLLAGCMTPAQQAASYGVTEQQLAQCRFESTRGDDLGLPSDIALCLKGHGYHQ